VPAALGRSSQGPGIPPAGIHRASLFIRGIWAACLLVAGLNHARILLQHGILWDYGGASLPSVVYWTSLTFIDPLAAALLFARPRLGIAITCLLIVTNVMHNLTVMAQQYTGAELLTRVASSFFMMCQIGFMLFVAATARLAWRGAGRSAEPI
jgi:hypothetical protein